MLIGRLHVHTSLYLENVANGLRSSLAMLVARRSGDDSPR